MKKYQKILIGIIGIFVLVGGIGFYFLCYLGTPFQTPSWSPNKQYYVQKYRVLTLNSFLPSMPGSGQDNIDGYIRVYDRDGKFLHEKFYTYLVGQEFHWYKDNIYIMGSDEADWKLPTSAE